jgi:hypothetical protein
VVAAEQGGPPAPTAATGQPSVILDHEIGAVGDQLAVQAHDVERGGHRVRLQERLQKFADRGVHQVAQRRQVLGYGEAKGQTHRRLRLGPSNLAAGVAVAKTTGPWKRQFSALPEKIR